MYYYKKMSKRKYNEFDLIDLIFDGQTCLCTYKILYYVY